MKGQIVIYRTSLGSRSPRVANCATVAGNRGGHLGNPSLKDAVFRGQDEADAESNSNGIWAWDFRYMSRWRESPFNAGGSHVERTCSPRLFLQRPKSDSFTAVPGVI